jgi:hypothetical protein
MADDDSEEEETIELGSGQSVEGAPLARVAERLMWGIEKSTIEGREGDTLIRTPDGPQELGTILDDVETTYFDTRQRFEEAVHEVIGPGPVPTPSDSDETDDDEQFGETLSEGGDETETNEDDADGQDTDDE